MASSKGVNEILTRRQCLRVGAIGAVGSLLHAATAAPAHAQGEVEPPTGAATPSAQIDELSSARVLDVGGVAVAELKDPSPYLQVSSGEEFMWISSAEIALLLPDCARRAASELRKAVRDKSAVGTTAVRYRAALADLKEVYAALERMPRELVELSDENGLREPLAAHPVDRENVSVIDLITSVPRGVSKEKRTPQWAIARALEEVEAAGALALEIQRAADSDAPLTRSWLGERATELGKRLEVSAEMLRGAGRDVAATARKLEELNLKLQRARADLHEIRDAIDHAERSLARIGRFGKRVAEAIWGGRFAQLSAEELSRHLGLGQSNVAVLEEWWGDAMAPEDASDTEFVVVTLRALTQLHRVTEHGPGNPHIRINILRLRRALQKAGVSWSAVLRAVTELGVWKIEAFFSGDSRIDEETAVGRLCRVTGLARVAVRRVVASSVV